MLHGRERFSEREVIVPGADGRCRTPVFTLGRWCSSVEPRLREFLAPRFATATMMAMEMPAGDESVLDGGRAICVAKIP